MELMIEQQGETCNVALRGAFTFVDNKLFMQLLTRLEEIKAKQVVFDLAETSFIDSAGLGMLLLLRDECAQSKTTITLLHPQKQVKKMFNLARFDQLFDIQS